MNVTSNKKSLKRRIDAFLWEDESLPLVRLREIFSKYFMQYDDVGIVGGMVRDLAYRGVRGFKSDIDLVINAPSKEVANLARHLSAKENRFGGFGFYHPLWKIDFWALENTWAVKNELVKVNSIEDVIMCTFFDCDSCLYNIKTKKLHSSNNYLNNLNRRSIEVNLLPNPSINGNLLRGIRRIILWNMQPGPILRDFITDNLNQDRHIQIKDTENRLYSNTIIDKFMNYQELIREVNFRSGRSVFNPSYGQQLEFPFVLL